MVSLHCSAHCQPTALHEGMRTVFLTTFTITVRKKEKKMNKSVNLILLSFCQTVVEPARKAEEVSDRWKKVKVSDGGGSHFEKKMMWHKCITSVCACVHLGSHQ